MNRVHFASSAAVLVALLLCGCYRESGRKVTDDPKYVGSYRRGQIYVFKISVDGIAKAGEKVQVDDAYLMSGINYSRVEVYGHVIGSSSSGSVSMLGVSIRIGDQNLGGAFVSGPDPKYLELVKA